jgi:predicted DsbA family dithiol-disulfide isomerase
MDEKAPTVSGRSLARDFRVAWGVAGFLALLVVISWGLVAWMWSRAMQPASAVQRTLPLRATAQAGACAPLALVQTPSPSAEAILAKAPTLEAPTAAAGDQPSLSADFTARLNQLVSTGRPFQLDLFVMSKCPYGNIAEGVLLPWLQNHPGTADFHLWYIASGDLTSGFQSLHGPTEVMEDLRQEAILTNYPAKLNDYLACRNANYSDDSGWIECASKVGLDSNELDSLAQTSETANTLAQDVQHVDALGVHASPTVYLNGQAYSGSPFTLPAPQGAQASGNTNCNPSGGQPAKVNATLDPGLQAKLDQLATSGQKLHLELFVMSLCPYGNMAETVLLPWLKTHPSDADLSLQFIAAENGSNFQSLHGPNEVSEDLRQLALAQHYPAKLNDYLACRSANYSDPNGWIACAVNQGLKADEISQFAQSAGSASALRTSLTRANSLGVQASPTLYLNGSAYSGAIFDIQQ